MQLKLNCQARAKRKSFQLRPMNFKTINPLGTEARGDHQPFAWERLLLPIQTLVDGCGEAFAERNYVTNLCSLVMRMCVRRKAERNAAPESRHRHVQRMCSSEAYGSDDTKIRPYKKNLRLLECRSTHTGKYDCPVKVPLPRHIVPLSSKLFPTSSTPKLQILGLAHLYPYNTIDF